MKPIPRRMRMPGGRMAQRGVALLELLIGAPLVLLAGLGAVQWALLFQARSALEEGLLQAVRAGTVAHADPGAIDEGLARGLLPWLYGADSLARYEANLLRAREHVAFGRGAGWIELRQLAPTGAAFDDWSEPALDDDGRPMAALLEIPNDNLQVRMRTMQPASGVSGHRGDEPIGAASGVTLLDANLLKVELIYGVPLSVPLVGRFAAWVMRQADGCEGPSIRSIGLMASSGRPLINRDWTCAYYQAMDEQGRPLPRWPVRLSSIARMQSPVRHAGSGAGSPAVAAGEHAPNGSVSQQADADNRWRPGGRGGGSGTAPSGTVGGAGGAMTGGTTGGTMEGATGSVATDAGSPAAGSPAAGSSSVIGRGRSDTSPWIGGHRDELALGVCRAPAGR